MKFWNLTASEGGDGEGKALDITLFGVIDGGWFDAAGVVSAEIARQLADHADAKQITVRINSEGGDMFGGVSIYNMLQEHPAAKAGKLTSIVEGVAASAASIIAMAGRTVMARGAMLMIHNPLTLTVGDAQDHRASADMLDKARDSLLSIYRAKTGKKPAELKALLDAETWMTAEEAKQHGFADEIAGTPPKVKAEGENIILNSVTFPRSRLPAPILAMATASPSRPADPPAAVQFTRELLAAQAPDLLASILAEGHATGYAKGQAEGHATGVTAERARIQSIDELEIAGHAALIAQAKYGETPMSAEQLAIAAIKASKLAGADLLERRRQESAAAACVRPGGPESINAAAEKAAVKSMVDEINKRRGGAR